MSEVVVDAFDARRAARAAGALGVFNAAGVLSAADVHVACRLGVLSGCEDELALLGAAFAVRGPRLGHVFVDLATIAGAASVEGDVEVDLTTLPWPDPTAWAAALAAAEGLVAVGEEADTAARPLRLVDGRLYLDRYWREERAVAADFARFAASPPVVDEGMLRDGLGRVFAGQTDGSQVLAAATAVLRRFGVVAGGPGTGKTTTVARIAALLCEQALAAGEPLPLIALAAPTGKAAARLAEAVHAEAAALDVAPEVREALLALDAVTLHRLLGWRPGSRSRFRHHRGNRLPHDVVIVDETSMVGLSLMARLAEAVRKDARLLLVGDPGQLSSIEAGAVLGDIVGPADETLLLSAPARRVLGSVTGREVAGADPPPGAVVADGIVVLDRVHRYGSAIAALATAIRAGDADTAMEVLRAGGEHVTWLDHDPESSSPEALGAIRDGALAWAHEVRDLAVAGDAAAALRALGGFRVLCAHRRGAHGAETWVATIERWLQDAVPDLAAAGRFYPGRPLLITENDYGLKLFNGDTGVVVATPGGRVTAAFERRDEVLTFAPSRLAAVETVYAMTIHKSQGSQFGTAAVVLPEPTSRLLTRELLYTAVTRAQDHLVLAGAEETIRTAIERPIARASGLRERLWA